MPRALCEAQAPPEHAATGRNAARATAAAARAGPHHRQTLRPDSPQQAEGGPADEPRRSRGRVRWPLQQAPAKTPGTSDVEAAVAVRVGVTLKTVAC